MDTIQCLALACLAAAILLWLFWKDIAFVLIILVFWYEDERKFARQRRDARRWR